MRFQCDALRRLGASSSLERSRSRVAFCQPSRNRRVSSASFAGPLFPQNVQVAGFTKVGSQSQTNYIQTLCVEPELIPKTCNMAGRFDVVEAVLQNSRFVDTKR